MALFKKKEEETLSPTAGLTPDQLAWMEELNQKYSILNSDTQVRLAKYRLYHSFTQGEQWIRIPQKQDGGEYLTHNLCDQTVRKYASQLMGDVPKLVIPRESELKPKFDLSVLETPPQANEKESEIPVEFDRSEAIEKILRECLYQKNNIKKEFYTGAYNGSELGDTCFYIYWDKKKKAPCIEEIFAGHVRVAFATNNSEDIEYAFIERVMSIWEIKRRFNFDAVAEPMNLDVWDPSQFKDRKVALVKFYWDQDRYSVVINNIPLPEYTFEHGYGMVPIFWIPNLINGKTPNGESDLKDVVPIQESYNKSLSDEANLSRLYAKPKVIVKNPGKTNLANFKNANSSVIPISKDASVDLLAFTGQIFPMQNRIQRIKQDYHDVSGLPEAAFGRAQGSIVTGVAMTAQYSPLLLIVMTKILLWDAALTRMMGLILELYEKFGGTYPGTKLTYKDIINGWRYVEWQWGSKMPRDDSIFIQNEILKKNQGVQSRSRTMSNLGIDSPQDELEEIALEENNPTLNPRLAIEKAMAASQTGEGSEQDMIVRAQQENEQMSAGQALPAVARNAKEHKIHIEVHSDFIKNKTDLAPEAIDIIDQHISEHEAALASGSQGHGGARMNAGRPAAPEQAPAGPEQLPPEIAAALAAGAQPQQEQPIA